MLFNSAEFAVFLAVVLGIHRALPVRRRTGFLVLASYFFYGWWDWRFLSLVWLSTAVDFVCAGRIDASDDPRVRRRFLSVSLVVNLGLLAVFKYLGFFVESFRVAFAQLGIDLAGPALEILLPIGISFYTFQTLSYTIDVYRGHARATRDLPTFALYVAFFPQLLAGPIERSRTLLPQLLAPRRLDAGALAAALELILLGFFKKICIADGLAPLVDRAFASPGELSGADLLIAAALFSAQIWGDFSGYTDIARGVARLFGIELRLNFLQPYLAVDITDFWRRWHVSLSSWLRDYLYIPLGGNRHGRFATYRNLFVTMLLGGLWHGAAWTFVLWGAYHGALLAIHRLAGGRRRLEGAVGPSGIAGRAWHGLRVAWTFLLVSLGWILFRAEDLPGALAFGGAIVTRFGAPSFEYGLAAAFYLPVVFAVQWIGWSQARGTPVVWPGWLRGLGYAAMILSISFLGASDVRPFIYFQF